jgi:RimJ/RimL family protein N-acetyltransferase
MLSSFPDHLASARLRLRRLRPEDAAPLHAYRSLPEVARYQYWYSFGLNDAARLIESQANAQPNVPGTWFQLALVSAATDNLIGDCGLHCQKREPRQIEIGITLAPSHQGSYYADEALECVLHYVFETLDTHRVFATVDVLNRSAIALCRRLKFRQEAHFVDHLWFKGRWSSEFVFALLKREWQERSAP